MNATQPKPLKRDVDAVKAKFPRASVCDFQVDDNGAEVTFYQVGDDWEDGDGVLGKGDTIRDAWAAAAAAVKAGRFDHWLA